MGLPGQLRGCFQAVAPALGTCSRVLNMPQNRDRDSGREQEIPGCHSLSRHTHTILQRRLKSLQLLPRNGARGSQTCQLARMLYMSIWKPQEFASDTTGICFPSADQTQWALPVPPQGRPIRHLGHSGFAVTPTPSLRTAPASPSACSALPPPPDKPCSPLPCRAPHIWLCSSCLVLVASAAEFCLFP